ncbi:DUF2059 domain-containing protein [Parabacteroides sp. FAFU027]|uniref:DUF2059 domain-containing protein n=1 Tax=Parabacteroides sp. FAFU027 TaxID=2922715 RepID=UPI001FAF4068|nr:DUF2059 domain-containing protein [Parabacteroides sp. FAFU027]
MKRTIITLFLCSGIIAAAFAQSAAKSKKIDQLLELTGMAKVGVQMAQNMLNTMKASYPKVDAKFWTDFQKEMSPKDLNNLIKPIYDKYYTEADIDQLITFYNSPIGKKVIQQTPAISQESMLAGQNWGKQLAEKILKRLEQQKGAKEKHQ